MNPIVFLFFTLILTIDVFAQTPPVLDGANSITIAELRDHIYYLASDELMGRRSGTPGYDKAAEYAVSQFRQAGIKPLIKTKEDGLTYLQAISFEKFKWSDTNTISIKKGKTKDTYKIHKNFFITNGAPYSQTELEGELAFIGAGIREPEYGIDNYQNIDVKGKWVVTYIDLPDTLKNILPKEIIEKYKQKPDGTDMRGKYAVEAGAIGRVFIPSEGYIAVWNAYAGVSRQKVLLKDFGNSGGNIQNNTVVADSIMLTNLFEDYSFNPIEDEVILTSFSLGKTKLKLTKEVAKSEFRSHNIVGMIKGTDPQLKNEFVSLGAHLDHIGVQNREVNNGANDNASGSAGVIEVAEAIAKSQPARSVLFILYTAEEMSLLGSKFIVEEPPVSLEQIKVNVNLEMLGRSDGDVEYKIAPLISDPVDLALKESIVDIHNKYPVTGLDWAFAESFPYKNSTDHFSFHKKGIPAVTFITNVFPDDFHTPGDDAHKIDYEFLQKNCRFVYHLVMELANYENQISSKKRLK